MEWGADATAKNEAGALPAEVRVMYYASLPPPLAGKAYLVFSPTVRDAKAVVSAEVHEP